MIQQHAAALGTAAPDTAAQLVQLRQAETLGILDDHQAGIGHVHADLDHGGRHQQIEFAGLERRHDCFLLRRLEAPVHQTDAQLGQCGTECFERVGGGLRLQAYRILR